MFPAHLTLENPGVVADTLFEIADIDDDGSLNFPEFVAVSRQHSMRSES